MIKSLSHATVYVLNHDSAIGGGAFETADCAATYEDLKSRGVQFRGAPKKEVYGLATVFTDDSGNFFSLTQH